MSPPKASVNPSVSLIELNLISFSYGIKPVIKEVVLNISQGEFIGVIGPNGSGKSTLLKLMNGIRFWVRLILVWKEKPTWRKWHG